jgi:hypothetical protein
MNGKKLFYIEENKNEDGKRIMTHHIHQDVIDELNPSSRPVSKCIKRIGVSWQMRKRVDRSRWSQSSKIGRLKFCGYPADQQRTDVTAGSRQLGGYT